MMKNHALKKMFIFLITLLLLLNFNVKSTSYKKEKVRIALYDSVSPSVRLIESSLHYSWNVKNRKYEMELKRIDFKDVINESLKNYDVLIIGASGRQYFHGLIPKWKEEVKKFIENGGGYVGICGGANIASMGYEKPHTLLDFIINIASLRIVDAYINDDQNEEWQYLWKEGGRANIAIKNEIVKNDIFAGMKERYITYGGGPGLYKMNDAKGLAKYVEEPSDVAPLHYWTWTGKWIPYKTIKTDIKGYYSSAETTYGKGKVVIFGGHPEIPPRINGSVDEFFGLSIYGIPRYVYSWVGGEQMNWSYNWWILRRTVAYVCNLPLPPPNELYVYVNPPSNGEIEAYAENAEKVEFYIDGNLFSVDYNPPFKIKYDMKGEHIIKAIAFDGNGGEAWNERIVNIQ
ncbi:MAG TPA: hypothetical protein ENI33_02245 [Thermoplasmatales archaeon]|nr:hypothetical protein [Thermoplasmatales archaeon]